MPKENMTNAKDRSSHCAPWECTLEKEKKSQCVSGKSPKTDNGYFEILSLCVLQAGLGWAVIRKNWKKYKKGFLNFDINNLAEAELEKLLESPGIIRNRKKVLAIIQNAQEFRKIKREHGSFKNFLASLAEKDEKEAVLQLTLIFHHLGRYSAEYFLHSVGYFE